MPRVNKQELQDAYDAAWKGGGLPPDYMLIRCGVCGYCCTLTTKSLDMCPCLKAWMESQIKDVK